MCRTDGLDAVQQLASSAAPEQLSSKAGALRASSKSPLQDSVVLLTACRPDELRELEQLTGPKKVLAVFRSGPTEAHLLDMSDGA